MTNLELQTLNFEPSIDATGKMVFPCFCDSHTHLVYPASREIEYVDKIKGLSYEEIAKRGGGILNSAKSCKKPPKPNLSILRCYGWKKLQGWVQEQLKLKADMDWTQKRR